MNEELININVNSLHIEIKGNYITKIAVGIDFIIF